MDNFMEKLSQRFNAQEIIKANTQAEAQEMENLRSQIQEYDTCLQEMRKLNLKNIETVEQVRSLAEQVNGFTKQAITAIGENEGKESEQIGKIEAVKEEITSLQKTVQDTLKEMKEDFAQSGELIAGSQEKLTAANAGLEDFMHRESVKVYRNVQAAVTEELKNHTNELSNKIDRKSKGNAPLYILVILTLLISIGNLGITIAQLFNLF